MTPEDELQKDVSKLVKQTLSVFGPLLKWAIDTNKFSKTIVNISSKFVENKINQALKHENQRRNI